MKVRQHQRGPRKALPPPDPPKGRIIARESGDRVVVATHVGRKTFWALNAFVTAVPPLAMAGAIGLGVTTASDLKAAQEVRTEICAIDSVYPDADEVCLDPYDVQCDFRVFQAGTKWIALQDRIDRICGRPKAQAAQRMESADEERRKRQGGQSL